MSLTIETAVDESRDLQRAKELLAQFRRDASLTQEEAWKLYQVLTIVSRASVNGIAAVNRWGSQTDPLSIEAKRSLEEFQIDVMNTQRELQALLDAFEGHLPAKIPHTMSHEWARLLDHILLYHELEARSGTSGKTPLEDVLAEHNL